MGSKLSRFCQNEFSNDSIVLRSEVNPAHQQLGLNLIPSDLTREIEISNGWVICRVLDRLSATVFLFLLLDAPMQVPPGVQTFPSRYRVEEYTATDPC